MGTMMMMMMMMMLLLQMGLDSYRRIRLMQTVGRHAGAADDT